MSKLKIFLAAALMIAAMTNAVFAKDFYIRMGGGYGFGTGGTYMGNQCTTENTWTKDVAFSVGQGFPITGELGSG